MGSKISKQQDVKLKEENFSLDTDDEIRRTSTTSEKAVLSLPKIYTALSDIFHHVFYLQRGSPFCELNERIKRSLEECLVSLNHWVKEEYSDVLTESELKILQSHLSCAQRLNKDTMICAGELVTCLSQVLNLVQKLLVNTTYNQVRSKEDCDAPGVYGTSKIFTRKQNFSPLPNISDESDIVYQLQTPPQTDSEDNEPEQVLNTLDEILARYDEGVLETNQFSHAKQDSVGTLVCHQKQDSDCTIINEFVQQEVDTLVDSTNLNIVSSYPDNNNSITEELPKTPEKVTFRGLFTSLTKKQENDKRKVMSVSHKENIPEIKIQDQEDNNDTFKDRQSIIYTGSSNKNVHNEFSANTDETETLTDDNDMLSNIVTFFRTNSKRLKRSIRKENNNDKEVVTNMELDVNRKENSMDNIHQIDTLLADINRITPFNSCSSDIDDDPMHKPDNNLLETDNKKSSICSAEMCKPVYGYLRRSESGPITLSSTPDSKIDKVLVSKYMHNTVPPYRTKLCFDYEDSGFESNFSASFSKPKRHRKKCIAPLSIKNRVARQSQSSNGSQHEEFKFREHNSPNALLETNCFLPALTDVSDDGDDERAEIFFGKFPGKPKVPLKTERDFYQTTCHTLQFSNSDEEDEDISIPKKCTTSAARKLDTESSLGTIDSDILFEPFRPDNIDLTSKSDQDYSDIIISPVPGENENLIELFSENYEAIEMICETNLIERKILTGRLILWTPDFKQKIQKVYISRQKIGSDVPENAIKLCKDGMGRWCLCHTTDNRLCSGSTNILLTVETDTERSESVSTTATSPLYEPDHNIDNMNTDEELYYNIREEMKNLDETDLCSTPNNDELPVSVIDYMNRNFGP